MMLVPIYFLIALWGHKGSNGRSRVYAATKFFLYTQIAGLVMLIGILGLVVYGYMMTGMIGFDYNYLLAVANRLPAGFAYGFKVAVSVALRTHCWVFLMEIVSPTCTTNTSGLPLKSALTKNTSARSPKMTKVFHHL